MRHYPLFQAFVAHSVLQSSSAIKTDLFLAPITPVSRERKIPVVDIDRRTPQNKNNNANPSPSKKSSDPQPCGCPVAVVTSIFLVVAVGLSAMIGVLTCRGSSERNSTVSDSIIANNSDNDIVIESMPRDVTHRGDMNFSIPPPDSVTIYDFHANTSTLPANITIPPPDITGVINRFANQPQALPDLSVIVNDSSSNAILSQPELQAILHANRAGSPLSGSPDIAWMQATLRAEMARNEQLNAEDARLRAMRNRDEGGGESVGGDGEVPSGRGDTSR